MQNQIESQTLMIESIIETIVEPIIFRCQKYNIIQVTVFSLNGNYNVKSANIVIRFPNLQ